MRSFGATGTYVSKFRNGFFFSLGVRYSTSSHLHAVFNHHMYTNANQPFAIFIYGHDFLRVCHLIETVLSGDGFHLMM